MAVIAPPTVTLSRSVCPSTSRSPLTFSAVKVPSEVTFACAAVSNVPSRLPVNVVAVIAPPTVTLSRSVCPSTSRSPDIERLPPILSPLRTPSEVIFG